MALPAEIKDRPCPPWCAKQGHRYTADSWAPWDLVRTHRAAFDLNGRRAMVKIESFDEYAANALRGSDEPDEDWVGKPGIGCDVRIKLGSATASEARRAAEKAQRLADQLRAAADRLDEINKGDR